MNSPLISRSAPYVADNASPPTDAWAQEAAAAGGKGTQKILNAGTLDPPAAVTEALCLPPHTPVVVRQRLVLLTEQPVEIATAYYPATIATDTALAEPRKVKGGVAAYLAERGWIATRTVEEVSARVATTEEREQLGLGDSEWVLVLTRLSLASSGTPFEYAIMVMRTQGRKLRYELGAPQ